MATNQSGGSFLPNEGAAITGAWTFSGATTLAGTTTISGATSLSTATLASPVVNGTMTGTAVGDRVTKTGVFALTGAAIHAGTGGVVAWTNPEGAAIMVLRAVLDLTTASTGACTLDIGLTEVSATTTSDTLLDGIDANAATAVFDSMNAALDSGANAKAQKLASAKWVTVDEKTGDATGLVANLYITYYVI